MHTDGTDPKDEPQIVARRKYDVVLPEVPMIFLWIVLGLLGAILVLGGVLFLVLSALGKNIPIEHTATSYIVVAAPPDKVFDAVADIQSHVEWAKGTTRVHMLPEKDGLQQARVHMGRNSFILLRTRSDKPKLIERTISDDHGPFSGTWLYKFAPVAGSLEGREGTEVRLTETGRVNNPVARAIMKRFFGYHTYTHRHLESLARKFGTDAKAHRA